MSDNEQMKILKDKIEQLENELKKANETIKFLLG